MNNPRFPWLLYAYPWMPFPRRVIIYLKEKGIDSSLITIVGVSDPPHNQVLESDKYPPRPTGSLPILAIPNDTSPEKFLYIRQSMAIINYIDELCETGQLGFPTSSYNMRGGDIIERARISEVLSLAEELTVAWNPVRTFGTGAGTMSIPEASKEMLRWVKRPLATIEGWWKDRDMDEVRDGSQGVTIADVVLYQFLEFTKDCYGVDMTKGANAVVNDVYGREVRDEYPKLAEFYQAFSTRESAKRHGDQNEHAAPETLRRMRDWADGCF